MDLDQELAFRLGSDLSLPAETVLLGDGNAAQWVDERQMIDGTLYAWDAAPSRPAGHAPGARTGLDVGQAVFAR